MTWLILLLACDTQTDAEHYQAALTSDWEVGLTHCRQVDDASTEKDCVAAVLNGAAAAGVSLRQVQNQCVEQFEDAIWRDECLFGVVDSSEVTGPTARSACDRAGRWKTECNNHALLRELAEVDASLKAPGQERALFAKYLESTKPFAAALGEESAEQTAERHVIKVVSMRFGGGRLEVAKCGKLGQDLCARAYADSLLGLRNHQDLAAGCGDRVVSSELLERNKLPGWDPGTDDMGRAAWRQVCAIATGPGEGAR